MSLLFKESSSPSPNASTQSPFEYNPDLEELLKWISDEVNCNPTTYNFSSSTTQQQQQQQQNKIDNASHVVATEQRSKGKDFNLLLALNGKDNSNLSPISSEDECEEIDNVTNASYPKLKIKPVVNSSKSKKEEEKKQDALTIAVNSIATPTTTIMNENAGVEVRIDVQPGELEKQLQQPSKEKEEGELVVEEEEEENEDDQTNEEEEDYEGGEVLELLEEEEEEVEEEVEVEEEKSPLENPPLMISTSPPPSLADSITPMMDLVLSFPELVYQPFDGLPMLLYHTFEANQTHLCNLAFAEIVELVQFVSGSFPVNKKRASSEDSYNFIRESRDATDLLFLATGAVRVMTPTAAAADTAAVACAAAKAERAIQNVTMALNQAKLQLFLPGIYNQEYYRVPHFARTVTKQLFKKQSSKKAKEDIVGKNSNNGSKKKKRANNNDNDGHLEKQLTIPMAFSNNSVNQTTSSQTKKRKKECY